MAENRDGALRAVSLGGGLIGRGLIIIVRVGLYKAPTKEERARLRGERDRIKVCLLWI